MSNDMFLGVLIGIWANTLVRIIVDIWLVNHRAGFGKEAKNDKDSN